MKTIREAESKVRDQILSIVFELLDQAMPEAIPALLRYKQWLPVYA